MADCKKRDVSLNPIINSQFLLNSPYRLTRLKESRLKSSQNLLYNKTVVLCDRCACGEKSNHRKDCKQGAPPVLRTKGGDNSVQPHSANFHDLSPYDAF
jgi:hypothetical protein